MTYIITESLAGDDSTSSTTTIPDPLSHIITAEDVAVLYSTVGYDEEDSIRARWEVLEVLKEEYDRADPEIIGDYDFVGFSEKVLGPGLFLRHRLSPSDTEHDIGDIVSAWEEPHPPSLIGR